MIHSGIGGTQLSNCLSVFNIHIIDLKALIERENETRAALETQAEIYEEKYLLDEINQLFTEENGTTQTGISVSTDTCWQKKGSGRSYNSLSGMEPDMVVEMLKQLDDKDIPVSKVVGDDDSTGFNRAKKLMPNSSMVNDLKEKHKELSGMVAESIVKNVSYVLDQNIGNADGIEFYMQQSIMYGDHQYCTENWCGYLKNKENYVHSNLPYGKDLSSASLESDLENLYSANGTKVE
ncbi:unnamed protein product [Mytilus coruscus]|uniref:Mutator-like transposase domain-containing protein n=1 Tax=Mytilus coruscus TaxID=42192 RepID=A0A6J8F0Z2_MYTCO|nr:unnamed protein product [Mytilus coruscus]